MSLTLPHYDGTDEDQLRSHLSLLHGVYVRDVKEVDGLLDCHAQDHGPQPFGHRPILHIHQDPATDITLEEWTWE